MNVDETWTQMISHSHMKISYFYFSIKIIVTRTWIDFGLYKVWNRIVIEDIQYMSLFNNLFAIYWKPCIHIYRNIMTRCTVFILTLFTLISMEQNIYTIQPLTYKQHYRLVKSWTFVVLPLMHKNHSKLLCWLPSY